MGKPQLSQCGTVSKSYGDSLCRDNLHGPPTKIIAGKDYDVWIQSEACNTEERPSEYSSPLSLHWGRVISRVLRSTWHNNAALIVLADMGRCMLPVSIGCFTMVLHDGVRCLYQFRC